MALPSRVQQGARHPVEPPPCSASPKTVQPSHFTFTQQECGTWKVLIGKKSYSLRCGPAEVLRSPQRPEPPRKKRNQAINTKRAAMGGCNMNHSPHAANKPGRELATADSSALWHPRYRHPQIPLRRTASSQDDSDAQASLPSWCTQALSYPLFNQILISTAAK